MDLATSVANKRLYVLAKSFRCNTYNKRGGRPSSLPPFAFGICMVATS
jgi:hypothetical protein